MKQLIRKNFFVLILSILLLIVCVDSAYSWAEDFTGNYDNPTYWEAFANGGNINFDSSNIFFSVNNQARSFPYVRSIQDISSGLNEFDISIKFRYQTANNFGTGITFSPDPPQNGESSGPVYYNHIDFSIWQDAPTGLSISTTTCPKINPQCAHTLTKIYQLGSVDFNDHVVKISYNSDAEYEVFLDGADTAVYQSAPGQRKISGVYLGNSEHTNTFDKWTNFSIDYISITTSSHQIGNSRYLLIPGFGASWDYDAILTGTVGNNWQIPTWVTMYDNLQNSLNNAGLVKDTDYFVYAYDWRKPLDQLADDLKGYLDALSSSGKIASNDRVKMVGHSYGGLVGRAYLQKYGQGNIEKIITLGSPHQGVAQTYLTWEGGEIETTEWWQKSALELVLELNRKPNESRIDAIQRLVPSINNLLPTTDFLTDSEDQPISNDSLAQQNTYLKNLNTTATPLNSFITTFFGTGVETLEKIKVKTPDWLEKTLGKWDDGQPISQMKTTLGDGTVLSLSATATFSSTLEENLDHGQLVYSKTGLENLFETLGIDKSKVVADVTPTFTPKVLVALLQSPGSLDLTAPGGGTIGNANPISSLGIYLPDQKMIVIPNYTDGEYQLLIDSAGQTGDYSLLVGNLSGNEPLWTRTGGQLTNGDTDTYKATVTEDTLKLLPQSGEELENYQSLLASLQTQTSTWPIPYKKRAEFYFNKLAPLELNNDLVIRKALGWVHEIRLLANAVSDQETEKTCLSLINLLEEILKVTTPTADESNEISRTKSFFETKASIVNESSAFLFTQNQLEDFQHWQQQLTDFDNNPNHNYGQLQAASYWLKGI